MLSVGNSQAALQCPSNGTRNLLPAALDLSILGRTTETLYNDDLLAQWFSIQVHKYSIQATRTTHIHVNQQPMAQSALFASIRVGSVELKNRIVMSALTRNRAENTYPTELMKEYYVQRADAGLIISEGILITRQGYVGSVYFSLVYADWSRCRTEWPNAPGLWDDRHVAGWKNIVDAVHAAGGKMYAQVSRALQSLLILLT